MAEYIGLAVDIGAYFFFSHMERRLKANLYDVRDNVPTFLSHPQLRNKLKASEAGEIAYARLDGRVEPTEQPLHTERDRQTAVVRITDNYRVRRHRSAGEGDSSLTTTTIESKVGTEMENVPFCVALNKDAGIYAKPEKINNLKQFGKTIKFADFDEIGNCLKREAKLFAKKFYPDDECLTSYEISKLTTRTGTLAEEYLLKCGSPVSVVGRVSWTDDTQKQIMIGCPTTANRLILTGDIDGLLLNMEDEAHRYNVGRRTAILAGVALCYLAWDRFYRDFTEWRKRVKRVEY